MLTFTFSAQSGQPLYKQLYDHLKSEIKSGNIRPGQRLSSKRVLAAHLKISLSTVETAYEQLLAEGYIRSVAKSGYFACALDDALVPPPEQPAAPLREDTQDDVRAQTLFDFKTNTVDTAFFPFATWVKLTKQIMHDENRLLLEPAHPQGDYPLRESIAQYLHAYRGVCCRPGQIIIGAGTEFLIGLIIQILGRDRVYAAENPGYPKTCRVFQGAGAQMRLVGLDGDGLRPDALLSSGADCVYVTPSHHFPLGVIMPVARRMQLLKWANAGQNRFIIEDDYDSEFRFGGRPIPALQGLDRNGRVIYLGTFSKSIAPSMRISYMVLPPELLDTYRRDWQFYSSSVSRFEQYTLYRFISGGHFERHLNRMRGIYRARKDRLVSELKKGPSGTCIEIIGENAGLHLLLRVTNGMDEEALVAGAQALGVRVYGLSAYYLQPEPDMPESTVVLGYADFDEAQLEQAVSLLKKAWFS